MIHRMADMCRDTEENPAGGLGIARFLHLFSPEETGGRVDAVSVVTLQPGVMVGDHVHRENGEIYWILTGCAMVGEDGTEQELHPGDAEFCADGHSHSIRNHTDQPMSFLALEVPNR